MDRRRKKIVVVDNRADNVRCVQSLNVNDCFEKCSSIQPSNSTGGVDTAAKGGVFDISNLDRLGFSEVELVQKVIDGINLLIAMEMRLENNRPINDLVPPSK